MKASKDRMEMLLEAIYSKVERMEGIMDQKPAADNPQLPETGIHGSAELQEIKKQIIRIRDNLNNTQLPSAAVQKHHYLWFFPDLKEWLGALQRGKFVTYFSLLSLALLILILFKYPDFKEYQQGYYKYQYLFFASDDTGSLKRYDQEWGVDSIRSMRMGWVDERVLK